MAFAISTPTSSLLQSSSSSSSSSSSMGVRYVERVSELGFGPFSRWNGPKQVGISISKYSSCVKTERIKGKGRGRGVYASLFGVGAPEALVIGVVALLVFGPKGLAEVARNLGQTLRGFQPTIRELQEVSREFKSTLEREIGLDEEDSQVSGSGAYTADEYLKVTEAQLKGAVARLQQEGIEKDRNSNGLQEQEEAASVLPPTPSSKQGTVI